MRTHEIRANYDRTSIVVYQAYSPAIGRPAVENGRFTEAFSRTRMTWIKPSFLWLMARSGWATKPGQEMILAVRITRTGWEEALSLARRIHALRDTSRAKPLLPRERPYPLPPDVARRIGADVDQ